MAVAPISLIARIERAADRGHGATFISQGRSRPRAVVAAARRRSRRRRRHAGARHPTRRPRRDPRPDQPSARHRDPGVLDRRRVRRGAPAADADGLARGVRGADAVAHPQRRRGAPPDRSRSRSVLRAGRRRPAVGAARPTCMPGGVARRPTRSSVSTTISTGWRSCSSPADRRREPKGVMLPQRVLVLEPRRDRSRRPPRTSTTTCSCRGCRCTTTWGSSAA